MIIEKDQRGVYLGNIVELPGCSAKGSSLDELRKNIQDAIFIYVAMQKDYEVKKLKFIGLQRIRVPINELDKIIGSEEEDED